MTDDSNPTRRRVLRTGAAALAGGVGIGSLGSVTAQSDDKLNPGEFGRVWANGVLWRTNVVRKLDGRPDNEDRIYFLHDGSGPIVAKVAGQGSPFVSETAPGDRDWNGGRWSHFAAEVTDVDAFAESAPLTSSETVLDADYIDVNEKPGRPGFGPPTFFLCPLNGRA